MFVAVLVTTLALKLAVNRLEPPRDGAAFVAAVTKALALSGFAMTVREHALATIIDATRYRCRMVIADEPPNGTAANVVTGVAPPNTHISYAWRGRLRDRAPRMAATIDELLRREARRIGFGVDRHPLTAIAMTRTCTDAPVVAAAVATLAR